MGCLEQHLYKYGTVPSEAMEREEIKLTTRNLRIENGNVVYEL